MGMKMLYIVDVLTQNVKFPLIAWSDNSKDDAILGKACELFCKYYLAKDAYIMTQFKDAPSIGSSLLLYIYSEGIGGVKIAEFSNPKPFELTE